MPQKRLIWFCHGMERAADQPDLLPRLRDEIGLTTIMPESPICHTSGFRVSDELTRRDPFADWRTRGDAYPKIAEGIYPPVAGIVGGFDDAPLLRLLESAQKAGIEVWGHIGLWSYGGDVYPEYAMRDIEDQPLDMRYRQWGIGLCPSRKEINDWTSDCLVYAAKRYNLDGYCVDHARYPAPANLHALFACGCAYCQRAATALGYDFSPSARGRTALSRKPGPPRPPPAHAPARKCSQPLGLRALRWRAGVFAVAANARSAAGSTHGRIPSRDQRRHRRQTLRQRCLSTRGRAAGRA